MTTPARAMDAVKVRHLDKLFIGGEWVPPRQAAPIDVVSPVTEEEVVVATIAKKSAQDMDRAVADARRAVDGGPWPRMSATERAGYMQRIGSVLAARSEELGHASTGQVGKLWSATKSVGFAAQAVFDRVAALAGDFPFEEGVIFPATGEETFGPVPILRRRAAAGTLSAGRL